MKELALEIPKYGRIEGFPFLKPQYSAGKLGFLTSEVLNVVFLMAGFLMFIWAFWGVFQYIFAGGNKESLAKARSRITWAIVGFIFIAIAFLISQYITQLLPFQEPKDLNL